MITLHLQIQVTVEETGMTLPGLQVKAVDKDFLVNEHMEGRITDNSGKTEIIFGKVDFDKFREVHREMNFVVYVAKGKREVYEGRHEINWLSDRHSFLIIRIPLEKLYGCHSRPAVRLFADALDPEHTAKPSVGDSLMISAQGLAPGAAHEIELHDDQGPLFISRLMANLYGQLSQSVLWPQFGLDDPRTGNTFSVDEATERWSGKKITVRIRHGKSELVSGSIVIGDFDRPFVMNTDKQGRMLNSFEDRKGEISVSGFNIFHKENVRVYLVKKQSDWKPGDTFEPVILRNGKQAISEVRPDNKGRFTIRLAGNGTIQPGAYDFIVRKLRYGYIDDEDLILRWDDVVTRRVTGIVVRYDFWESKVVNLGCVNMLSLSGHKLYEAPYFKYADAFAEGEDVYAATDPAALPPVKLGEMAAIYVIQSKTATQWDVDKSLTHLPILGGNASVIKFKTQSGCINHNDYLVWPGASIPGNYDIVLDFGNNTTDAMAFVPDDTYDINVPPAVGDIIDGYMVPGFRVVKDPGVYADPAFANFGGFDYTQGTFNVTDDNGFPFTVTLQARVRFPADILGATMPTQISAAKVSYPMVYIVHGNGHTYLAYDYLLEHWALNGFIAVSIRLEGGQTATDRAKVLFQHIGIINAQFGAAAQNNIGIMGHSRGGEAVATAPRLNQQGALGFNLNAVISLAPTNQYVDEHIVPPWATPYFVIYGALDADVFGWGIKPYNTPLRNCGFALYDKAEGVTKAMLFVYGATHDRFLAPPGDVDYDFNNLAPADQLNALSSSAHHAVSLSYMTAFFRQQLLGDTQYQELFKGQWVPPSVSTADGGKARVFSQYRSNPADLLTVDDFNAAHTATSWQNSSIGGGVAQTGLPADPDKDFLYVADNVHSPHNASGLLLSWDNNGDKLEFSIPSAFQDISSFKSLSFRVGQKYDATGTINPANADQDFYVMLHDVTGKQRMVKASKFGPTPYPQIRGPIIGKDAIKSSLSTILIPLTAYTTECAGAQRVDLTQVDKIAFIYQYIPTGQIEIDDLEFAK